MPKLSKHKKKSWRKQIDLNEFDEFFEDQRLEERVGKPEFDFVIQTHGVHGGDIPETVPQKQTKRLKQTTEIVNDLHCYKPLKVTTKVPPLPERKHPKTKVKLPKISKLVPKLAPTNSTYYDIWDTPKPVDDEEIQELKKTQRILVGKEPVAVPINLYQKPTLRSSVEVPMAGLSYNPSKQEHQMLLKSAVDIEEAKLRKEEKLAKKVTSNFVKKSDIDPHAWMKEMSQGLGSDEDEGVVDEEMSDQETVVKTAVVCKRKTKAQRAREKRNKLLRQASKAKVPEQQIGIKKVIKQLKEKEAKIEENIKKRDQKRIEKLKAGKESRIDEDIVISFSSDLKGSLRQVAPAGNLLEERFKSLQKRGLIEANGKKSDDKKKKVRSIKKTKKFVKKNHRAIE